MDLPAYVTPATSLIAFRSSFGFSLPRDSPSSSETIDAFTSPEAFVAIREFVLAFTPIAAYQCPLNLLHWLVQHLFCELPVGCREPLKPGPREPWGHIFHWISRLLPVVRSRDAVTRTERYKIHKIRPRLYHSLNHLNQPFGSCNVRIGHAGDLNTIDDIYDRRTHSPGSRIRKVASQGWSRHTLL